jgi:DNA-directed RNA polymerase specialized sigma24 family protein
MFEKVHPGFLQRLSANYTDLTPAETRFLVFLKLELDPKEMASMLGVSAEAIRSIRFRVKKKLMLEDARDISEYVKTI